MVKLRLSPVHADTLYVEFGAEATPASMKLDGRDLEIADLKVSFLAVDSTGEHDTGEPVEWRNRITLKSREYVDARSGVPEAGVRPGMVEAGARPGVPEAGARPGTLEAGVRPGMPEAGARPGMVETGGGQRMVEIRAAPPSIPIRYTTDGSDPTVAGGVYDEPFAVPEGARLILAVAGKDGIVSEMHRREIADKPVEKPIDRTRPAVWAPPSPGFEFKTTRTAYGFTARLKQHEGVASGLRINVQAEGSGTWSELHFSDDVALDGARIEQTVEWLRALVPDGEVSIEARRIRYGTGQRFLDHVAEIRAEYKRDDVEQ